MSLSQFRDFVLLWNYTLVISIWEILVLGIVVLHVNIRFKKIFWGLGSSESLLEQGKESVSGSVVKMNCPPNAIFLYVLGEKLFFDERIKKKQSSMKYPLASRKVPGWNAVNRLYQYALACLTVRVISPFWISFLFYCPISWISWYIWIRQYSGSI